MEMLLDNKPDLVDYNEQLGNSKIDFDNITEIAQDIEQNLDDGIKSCEVTVVSEHNMDKNIKSIENRTYNFSDSVVGDKVCEEDADSNYTLIIENVQERNDKGERCKDKESIVNEIIEFVQKEDNNIERFENIDDQDASLSARSEGAVKEDSRMMSNKGVEQDSHIYVEKSQIECWNSVSSVTEDVQLGPSNDRAPQILKCPVSVRLEISAGNEFSCSGNENTSGSNSDQQENDLLEKLDAQSSSLDPLEKYKQLIVSKKEVKAIGDLEVCEIPYSSQLEEAFPIASEASHGDVGKEKTVQNANRNLCHSSTNKCNVCGKVCLGQARMVSHMRVHSGEQPFDCKVCGLNFKYKENLKRHQKMHKSSKQRDTTLPNVKQMHKTLEQRKMSNSYYLDIHEPFQSSVIKSRDEVKCLPQTEGIKGCSASNDNFADTNVCKETEISASVKEYVNSHCRFLKGDERKLISSVDKVLGTKQCEQNTVEIFACSVVLDKINLQEQETEVYLKHHTKEKLTTSITPVQIQCPLGLPINSKTNADKEGSAENVEKNDPWGEGLFKCPLCNKSYSHKRSLNKHKRHVHPNLWHQETVLSMRSKKKIFMCKYKCDKCAFRFFSTAGLIRHQNKFCSVKLTDCSEEKKMCTSQSNQKVRGKEAQEMITSQSNEKVRGKEAQVLDYEYSQLRQLRRNVFSSSEMGCGSGNEKTNICRFCGRMFSRRINLVQHEQMHIRKKLNAVKSEAEQELFSSTSQNDHSPVNSDELSDASKRHKCKFCVRMFSRRINLVQHEQMHIRKKLNAVKSEAEQELFSSTSQNDHSPVNSDELSDVSKQHKCNLCGRMFSRRINLRQHEQMHVRERLNTTKSQAEHQSLASQSHQSPMNSDKVSDTSKTCKCEFCGRIFSRRINLIQHEQVHKRRKQVEMVLDEVCPMESDDKKRSAGPGKNIFKISSVQMNHKCRFCSRKFFRRCNLCQHERVCHRRQIMQKQKLENSNRTKTHNSSSKKVSVSFVENPLTVISSNKFNSCQYCRKIFSTKSNLNRHVKLHKQKKKFFKQKNNSRKRTDDSLYAKRKSPKSIRNQVRIISADNRDPCQYSAKWFPHELDLSQHLKLHSQKSIQLEQGNTVNSSSSVKSNLHIDTSESGQNIKRENINKTPHICRFCGRLFARRINLCQHERVCHRRQIMRKQKPENSNKTKTQSSNSKKVLVSSVENPLRVISNNKFNSCHYCRKCFSTKSNLSRHVKLHNQKKKFLKQKSNSSKRSDDILYAKRKSHDSIRNQVKIISIDDRHPCQYCGKWFLQKCDLSQHLKLHNQKSTQLEHRDTVNSTSSVTTDSHTDTSESDQNVNTPESGQNIKKENINKTPHICRFCGRLFARRINLCQHERVCHRRQIIQKQKPENSNKTKTHNSNSKKVSVSSGENPLRVISSNKFNSCQYCRKCFSTKSNLNRHVKLHNQKKKFLKQKNNSKRSDDVLYAKRKSHDSITDRVKIISTDYRHPCQYCGKWFLQKWDLSQHLKLHRLKSTQLEHGSTVNSASSVTTDSHTDTSESDQNVNTSESGQNIKKENINKTPHICRFCGRLFARRINLCQHERVCHRRQIIRKQKPENSNKTKTHNSNSKKVSVSSGENPLRVFSNNKFNSCQYCRKCFSTRSNLNRHVKLHKQKKKFLKQKNDNSKRSDDNLYAKRKSHDSIRNQVKIISTDNRHTCQYCGKWFLQKLDLSQHLKLHNQNSIYMEHGNTVNSASSVTTDLHTDISESDQNVNTSESGENIKKENINKTPHICRFCGRRFARRINLCQHEQWHKQKDGKVFKENNKKAIHICRICGRRFERRVNLCQHERWHSQKNVRLDRREMFESKPFQAKRKNKCRVCSKTCTNKSDLLLHYESRHTENLKCQICNTLLGTYVHLRKHMRTHVEFSMVDMKELSHHRRAKYTNAAHFPKKTKVGKRSRVTGKSHKVTKSKKYKCMICGMSFNTHSLLFLHKKKHLMSAHACFVCGKIFTRKFDLARHLRIHTGDQPHECDICLKGFRCRFNLADHMGTHVLKEANEFQCDGCKALFFDQQSILNHLESAHTSHHKVSHLGTQIIHNDNELHGNEHASGRENIESDSVINYIQSKKPIFSCGICGEVYEEASHLYLHMGNHVNESVEIENGKETGITVKAESCSPNRQMDSYQHSCKLENHSSHNDMQNSQGHVCLSDFVDTIKNETFVNEVSSLDGEGNTFDHATESLNDEYIDVGIDDTVDPSESVSKFLNVKHHRVMDERTINVDNNGADIGHITKILDCTELNKKFKCGLCMHMFSSKQGLSQHKRWHARTDIKSNQMKKDYCTVCKIYFSSKSSFTLHLNWHKSGLAKKVVISDKISIPLKPYRCEKCGKTFTRKDSLAKHKCMMHYSQDEGGDESRSKVVKSKGVRKLVVPNGFICEVCGCSYAQRACLVQHLLHKHDLAEKNFEAVCDEKEKPVKCQLFLNNAGLTSHNPKYQKGNQKAYKCIFCRKQYIKRHTYLLHTFRVHPNYYQQVLGKMAEESSNKKKCKYCKIWYNPNDNTGYKDGFNCKSCETIFPCKGCFIQHLDLPESSELEGVFWCCVCQIKFSNIIELKEHVRLHASDLGKYNCRMCRQIFKYKQHLIRHKKVHGISLQYNLKESYASKWCSKEFPYDAMHLHQKINHCTDHKTSRKPKKEQVLVNAKSYNCTNLTNAVEANMVSPAGVGSDIFSSPLPRQYDEIAQDRAYHEAFFTKTPDEIISDQGKEVASNLGSLEAFPVSIKQEPVDLCDNSVCGSTCTSPVKEVVNNGIVHNSDFDTSIQDSTFLNRVSSDATKFDLSPSVQLNERVEQDDIQSSFEDSEQDEVDIDNIHDRNSSPIDRSDMLYFVGSTMETGQDDGLALLKAVLEKPSCSEESSHKSPPGLFKAAFVKDMKDFDERQRSTELPILQMESSNKNDNFHSHKLSDNSEDNANDASKEDLLEASENTPKYLKQAEDVLRKDAFDHSHYQEHQIVKDHESTTPGINQESKEQRVGCMICCKTVYSQELVRHLQSHADLKLYECKHCKECFLSAMSYSEHMEENHGEIVCCACGETFTEKKDLIMHVRKHNFDVVLNCSICGAVFTSHETFSKHLEFHVVSEAKSVETQNDSSDDNGSRDIEIISSEDREEEEEEENLRALMEDEGDADKILSSVITSSSAAWKQMSMTLLSEGSIEAARRDNSATESIDNPGELLGTCKDTASSAVDEAADIKPDINKLHDTMLVQNAYKNMETIMGCNQTILDRMVQNSPCQVRTEPINSVSGTPLNWYSVWKKLAGKITGSEHTHLYDRCQKEQCQAAQSTSSNRFPIRIELGEPEKVPVIKKELFEQDTQLLIEESERTRTTGRTRLMQPGLQPCYVKLEKLDCKILTCRLCLRILVNENALKRHYLLHLIPGYKFS